MITNLYKWEILSLTRFFLAFIVLADHLNVFTSHTGPMIVFKQFGAFEAVLGFLLISGFSIGISISKNKTSYFKRRIKRIYPVYIVGIVIAYIITPLPLSPQLILTIAINLVFLNQVFTNTSFAGIPAWTLALEVWLYLLAPVLLKLSYRTLMLIIYGSFACYCLYTCGRTLYHLPYYAGTMWGINIVLLSYIWIAGFALSIFTQKEKNINRHIAAIIICHLLLTYAIQIGFRFKNHQASFILSEDVWWFIGKAACLVVTYCAVVFNHLIPAPNSIAKKAFNLLGNISYPLYITHWLMLELCQRLGIHNWLIMVTVCLTTSYLVYIIFDYYTVKRSNKTKPEVILAPVELPVL